MSYASIALFLHDPMTHEGVLDFAIEAARGWGAHLHVVCAGVDMTDPGFYYAGAQAVAVQENLEVAEDAARQLDAQVRGRLEREEIPWDLETVTVMHNGLSPFLGDHMRFFDLAILPAPYGAGRSAVDVAAFESCLFAADLPVLVVPEGVEWSGSPRRMMIAWDDGAEALAAARAAAPLASAAERTEVVVIDPPLQGRERSDPGGRLAQKLARAGAKVEVTVAARTCPDIADQLQRQARETAADLIVMGAYGHSRLREAVIGGVTRSMLRSAALPILMAR